jgi:hypothetical protein
MQTTPNQRPFSATITREIFASLCRALPRLVVDTPDNRASRDEFAMDAVTALHPTDALEAKLAMDIVIADAQASESFRLADECRADIDTATRCRNLGKALLNEMRSLLRDYRRLQAEREKALAEMHPAAMERAGYWFRDASVPVPPPEPEPAEPPRSAEPATSASAAVDFSALTEAEQYALIYPDRAARIRAEGGLPAQLDYGPPEPDIVEALVHGTSPVLRALELHPLAVAAR